MQHRPEMAGAMQITARYTRDVKRTFRITRFLRRRIYRVFRAIGVIFVLAAVLVGVTGKSPGTTAVLAVCGVIICVEPEAVLWLSLRRNREAIEVDVVVEVTEQEITSRTATETRQLGWQMIRRVVDTADCWVFVANRLQMVTLYKSALPSDQRAELAAFLASRGDQLPGRSG
jgi:YcxB-like protein